MSIKPTDPANDDKSNLPGGAPSLGEKVDTDTRQETGQPRDPKREPLPIEFREFTASVRDLFREIKKLIIFIRSGKNANAALVLLTFLLAIAAFTQALIYGIQLGPLRRSAAAATNANSIANNTLVESNRAWVGIEGTMVIDPIQLTKDRNGTTINATSFFTIKNFGKAPAMHVGWDALIVAYQQGEDFAVEHHMQTFKQEADVTCRMSDMQGAQPLQGPSYESGLYIFPDNRITTKQPLNDTSPNPILNTWLTVAGCISYKDQFKDTAVHHTRFCFMSDGAINTAAKRQALHPCPGNEYAD
jgi:hypothetical protein